MIGIATMLADAGMNLVSKFIDSGKDTAIDFIKEKTGIDLSDKDKLNAMDIVKLKEFEAKNREFLLKQTQMYLDDIENARQMRINTLTNENTPLFSKVFPDVLASVSVTATFVLFYLFASGKVPQEQKDIILYILGLLSGIVSTIYAYYYGSSKGNDDKEKHLQSLDKKGKK